jgi:hypothetical protein
MTSGEIIRAGSRSLLACAAALLLVAANVWAEDESLDLQSFRPQWQVGQTWDVEAVTRQTPVRRTLPPDHTAKPLRWQFEVQAVEPCEGRPCFRLRITCRLPGSQPETTLWVDQQTMTLRKIRMQIPAADGFRTMEETYRSSSGQPFPALAPLTLPPVELPVFQSGTKGQASFQYEAVSGPDSAKALGDVGFAYTVEQRVDVPKLDEYSSLLPADFAKSLEKRPTIQVHLKAPRQQVRQVWQAGLPWPVFSDNGNARSWLLPVADPRQETPPRQEEGAR